MAAIEADGIEAAVADPDRIGTVLDQIEGVTLIYWLLGSAQGDDEAIAALHGPRLERLLEEIVDTPVRGFVYEAAGTVGERPLANGARLVNEAQDRWRLPAAVVAESPGEHSGWLAATRAAVASLL
jgi:hypothetical protein